MYLLLLLPVAWGLFFWWGYRQGTEVVRPTPRELMIRITANIQGFADAVRKMGVAFEDAARAMAAFASVDLRASDGQVDTPQPEADLKL